MGAIQSRWPSQSGASQKVTGPGVWIGYVFLFVPIAVYAVIGLLSRTSDLVEYYVAGRRVPSAFNGVTGFKPTARRVPRDGCYPLSVTLDSIGPLAPDVASCALVDAWPVRPRGDHRHGCPRVRRQLPVFAWTEQ